MNTEIENIKKQLKDAHLTISYLYEEGWGDSVSEDECPAFIERAIKDRQRRDERMKEIRDKKLNSNNKT